MNAVVIMGIARHLLTLAGGYLAAKFAIGPDAIGAGVAALVTLIGVVWSVWAKTPYEPATAPLAAVAPTPSPAVETAPLGLLGDPASAPASSMAQIIGRADKAPYGYCKDGVTPRKRVGRKPANKKR